MTNIFANPNAQSLNLAPSPNAQVLTRVVPHNPLNLGVNYNPKNVGYVSGTLPQPPERALPSPINVQSLINSLPTLFSIFHG